MEILILAVLIIFNGFFSISEISIVTSKRTRLEQLKNAGSKGAVSALKLQDDSEMFISAVLVGMTLVSLIIGALGGMTFAAGITPYIERFELLEPYAPEIAMVVMMVFITYVTILIGELLPKTVALSNPEKVAVIIAPLITLFSRLFYPFVMLLSLSIRLVSNSFGIKKRTDGYTEYELRQMIKSASVEGVIEEEQTDMHEKVFHFSDKRAMHLMTHRIEVEWVDINDTEENLRKELDECLHTKVVCAEDSLDNFRGVINVRDFYKASLAEKNFKVTDLIKEAVVIHESTSASNVLKALKQNPMHFCVVVDEYGDFEGVITYHDIMENFIGDVPDEGEVDEPHFITAADGSVLVNGDAPVEVLSRIMEGFNPDFEQIDYATVAGFVIDQINEIPARGDHLDYLNYELEIIEMDGNRIDKIKIKQTIIDEEE